MLIRCKLHRPGGSLIQLGKGADVREYHFKPNASGDHVCEVTDKADIGTFLAIKEGYEVADGKAAPAAVPASAPATGGNNASGYEAMERTDLAALVKARTGKAPHGSAGKAKLIEQLQKLDAQA